MARRNVLSTSQQQLFEQIPTQPENFAKYYLLSSDDLLLIRKRRGRSNRLGFAIQLCLIRYPGRVMRANEALPEEFIAFVAEQIDTSLSDFCHYAERDETRREHLLVLSHHFALSPFKILHFKALVKWLVPIALDSPKSTFLVGAILNEMRHRSILHPTLSVVERMVSIAINHADQRAFNLISGKLEAEHKGTLDNWLIKQSKGQKSLLSWVRQPVGKPSAKNIVAIIERLNAIKEISLPESIACSLSTKRLQQLSREGSKSSIQHLRECTANRRYTIMTICLLDTRSALIDEAISMHDRMVSAAPTTKPEKTRRTASG